MATEDTLGARYQMRRQARGAEPPPERKIWRRRLIIGGVVTGVVVLLTVGIIVWYTLTHVHSVRASVAAAVIGVPAMVDARLAELCVEPLQHVTAGQELAKLDDPQVRAALEAAEATLALNESLCKQAEADCKLTNQKVENDLVSAQAALEAAKARVQQAEAALAMGESRLAEQVRQATAQRDEAAAQLTGLQKGAREEDVKTAQARLESARALCALYELEVRQSEQLVGEGIDSQYILETKKTQLTTQKKACEEAELQLLRLQNGATAEELDAAAQVKEAREAGLAMVCAGNKEVDNLKNDLVIRSAELRQAEAQLKQAETAQVQKELAAARLEAAQRAVTKAQQDVTARRDALVLKSPVSGTVIGVFNRVGDTCRTNLEVLQVTDDSKGRWIAVEVREKDAFYVRPEQKARVKLASGERIRAKVLEVGGATSSVRRLRGSPTGEPEPSGPESVRVKLVPEAEGALGNDAIPGMSARAVIRVR